MKRLMEEPRGSRLTPVFACAVALSLTAAACTGGSDAAAPGDIDETNPPALASEDGDEPSDAENADGEDASDDAPAENADDDETGDDDESPVGPTTPQTIVPPGETAPANGDGNGDDGGQGDQPTTTTASNVDTTDRSEQPIQEQDTALVCATVEQGFIAILSGSDDLTGLSDGADLAVNSGVDDYVVLGGALRDAVDADDGLQDAADALLSRCEADGFERLA